MINQDAVDKVHAAVEKRRRQHKSTKYTPEERAVILNALRERMIEVTDDRPALLATRRC